ncbi:unnamed protein product [Acanthoscelides obtectus]|uniref:DUF4817 domain-containing protein n=1 Tax=Acanthoscelides obtectus TaxID=200917 RepID=A0A9P0MAA6_ACAOB|nr:unnamed protein product [Acanthoscelides obtectus]CAK1682784.1 hypothetical protein AOBTE_LOCUS33879 [Acanthoscelides obtectus]
MIAYNKSDIKWLTYYKYLNYLRDHQIDRLLIYDESQRNSRRGARLYQERFPDRQTPSHAYYSWLVEHLKNEHNDPVNGDHHNMSYCRYKDRHCSYKKLNTPRYRFNRTMFANYLQGVVVYEHDEIESVRGNDDAGSPSQEPITADDTEPSIQNENAACSKRKSNTMNTPRSRPGKQNQDSLAKDVLTTVQEHFKRPRIEEGRFDVFGKSVAIKLREMDKRQSLIAEK